MDTDRSQAAKDLDARRNESARREVVAQGRVRSPTKNLEQGLALQSAALEFSEAFVAERRRTDG
jgi:hypothetical protein